MGVILSSLRLATTGGDADALAFIAAAGITDPTEQSAITDLVTALKSDGLWTILVAIYPFVGGSSGSHAVNLKSPGTYDLTWFGGVTHGSTGVSWNGTTGYADTSLVPSAALATSDTHLSYYSRTANTANRYDIGCFTGVNYHGVGIACYYSFSGYTALSYAYDGGSSTDMAGLTSAVSTDSAGFFCSSRTSTASHVLSKNGSVGTAITVLTGDFPSITDSVKIGGMSHNGTVLWFSNRECAFASVGFGLTNTEAADLYTAVQAFQTTLGRQV